MVAGDSAALSQWESMKTKAECQRRLAATRQSLVLLAGPVGHADLGLTSPFPGPSSTRTPLGVRVITLEFCFLPPV